jgi:gliding motility-associated-like protein
LSVSLVNTINNSCAITASIPLVVLPLPQIELNELGLANVLVCSDDPTFTRTLDAGLLAGVNPTDYTYQWFKDGTAISGATQPTLLVNEEGIYTVEVSTVSLCSRTRSITVTASEKATITSIDVADITETNSITVNTTGLGTYVYALDYTDSYQESNYFYNVAPGTHQVYVKDTKGCGTIGPIEVNVLGIPNFFTPNGDGVNDTWNVRGVTAQYNAQSVIRIYDRMGKLVKEISPLGSGWDGTFNGSALPADDYWYVISFEDQRLVKGHFSLKR